MGLAKRCKHTVLSSKCASCMALKHKWYAKLEQTGFVDIEYGCENPRFIAHTPDASAPGVDQSQGYYARAWQVFHHWQKAGRSKRDCRVAELFAAQEKECGTVRGISRILRSEKLAPWSTRRVHLTLKEIHALAILEVIELKPTESVTYVDQRHAAA